MNSAEAKRILIAHRLGREPGGDPDIVAALEQVRRDPALANWWQQQQTFHNSVQKGFREIPVPDGLRAQIRRRAKVIQFPWWRQPQAWAAAAAIILLIGIAVFIWRPDSQEGTFETYRSRMVRSVLRQYRMDIQTNDMDSIRQFLAKKKAPADYKLPPKLMQLPTTGGGVMSWQASRASMVCFNSGSTGTVFLFVVHRSDVKQPPVRNSAPQFSKVSQLQTASWAEGEEVYVLAYEDDPSALKKLF